MEQKVLKLNPELEVALLAEAPKQWERFQQNKLKRRKGKAKWQRETKRLDVTFRGWMSLQDFRGQGPPADIGVFQFPASVLVFQHTFSGTVYTCAVRAGVEGFSIWS